MDHQAEPSFTVRSFLSMIFRHHIIPDGIAIILVYFVGVIIGFILPIFILFLFLI